MERNWNKMENPKFIGNWKNHESGDGVRSCEENSVDEFNEMDSYGLSPADLLERQLLQIKHERHLQKKEKKASEFRIQAMEKEMEIIEREMDWVRKRIVEEGSEIQKFEEESQMRKKVWNWEQLELTRRELEQTRMDLEEHNRREEVELDRTEAMYRAKVAEFTEKWNKYKEYKENNAGPKMVELKDLWKREKEANEELATLNSQIKEKNADYFKMQCEQSQLNNIYGVLLDPVKTLVTIADLQLDSRRTKMELNKQRALLQTLKESKGGPTSTVNSFVNQGPFKASGSQKPEAVPHHNGQASFVGNASADFLNSLFCFNFRASNLPQKTHKVGSDDLNSASEKSRTSSADQAAANKAQSISDMLNNLFPKKTPSLNERADDAPKKLKKSTQQVIPTYRGSNHENVQRLLEEEQNPMLNRSSLPKGYNIGSDEQPGSVQRGFMSNLPTTSFANQQVGWSTQGLSVEADSFSPNAYNSPKGTDAYSPWTFDKLSCDSGSPRAAFGANGNGFFGSLNSDHGSSPAKFNFF